MPEIGFTSHRAETQDQWQLRMAAEVLAVTRSELYLDFRYFDLALSALTPAADPAARRLATDGVSLYFEPGALLRRQYGKNAFENGMIDALGQRPPPVTLTRQKDEVGTRRYTLTALNLIQANSQR